VASGGRIIPAGFDIFVFNTHTGTMRTIKIETYKGWTITVIAEQNKCSNFSFDITDPSGRSQHISMGGDNEQRALARAREMIDMEIALVAEE